MSHDEQHAPPLRFGVIGAGPMGICLAAMLGRSATVTMVVRDPQAAASLRRTGARVVGHLQGHAHPHVVSGIPQLTDAAPLDVIFVATKTTAIDSVAEQLRPVLGDLARPDRPPFVVSFQNGIDPGRRLMEQLQYRFVLRMVLNFGAIRLDPVTAEVTLNTPPHYLGSPDATLGEPTRSIAAALSAAGLTTHATDTIEKQVWQKGVLNASMNPVAALTDSRVGEVLDSPARPIVTRLMNESLAVAGAEGIGLDQHDFARLWQILEAARPHVPSMVEDIRRGRMTEIGQLNRQIIVHAARVGVQVPSHELITSLIDAFDWRVFRRAHAGHESLQPAR